VIRLISVEIENFRSIFGSPLKIDFDDFTVVVGANNCGKSNVLRALQLFFSGSIDGQPYTTDVDYPKTSSLNPVAQTKITVTVSYQPTKETGLKRALDEIEEKTDQLRLDDNHIALRLSYSKNGVDSWQFLGKKGTRNISKDLIHRVRDVLRQSVIFKYIPVGRDSLESITTELSSELIRTIFSGWSGAVKKRQEINEAIATLLGRLTPELKSSSSSVTASIRNVFQEVELLELRLPFANLEEMLPSLTPVILDTAETGLKSKGAGLQTSSLLFLLKYLADNHPQRNNARQTFVWAIEEPESFLHPSKQKAMAELMFGFSSEVQTVITTHCPHFVPRGKARVQTHILGKESSSPYSTLVLGNDFELARQTLGVTLQDSMILYPINIVVEGPSDEILLMGALRALSGIVTLNYYDVKFFPAGNATSAAYLFESLRSYSDSSAKVFLLLDGDEAGRKARDQLLGRASRDGIALKSNRDFFQLPSDVDNLLSVRVMRALHAERPAQTTLMRTPKGTFRDSGSLISTRRYALRGR
jgi:predicted ATP-dependent endonuclease of OLD family